jgi:hypothetical protein
MQKIKKLYRTNYAGESIVTELVLSNNDWQPKTEYITNSVFNSFTTTQAIAIGNGSSRQDFDLKHISNHKGGILAKDKLQSYACNLVINEGFSPDFLIAVDAEKVKTIAESGYCDDHIVYTNAQYILEYPGKFYLTPQNPTYDAGALAVYLACFDGHKKVYMMGYDSYTNSASDTFYVKTLSTVMDVYSDVEFVRVMLSAGAECSDALINKLNFRQISFRDFVTEADIG